MIDHNIIPPLSEFRFHSPVQLRFNDVDVLGHVNNTVYFSFYDTGKALYFTEVHGRQMDWKHVDTVIANVNCAYLHPIFFGDNIEVFTRCVGIGEKSFHLLQMLVDRNTETVKSVCESVMVAFCPEIQKAVEVSDEWRRALCAYEGRDLNEQPAGKEETK